MTSTPTRRVHDNLLTSTDLPPLRLRVDPAFTYAGADEYDLKGLARVERYHFVDAADGHIQRMLILQFEGFLPDNTRTYKYALANPVQVGALTYTLDVLGFSTAAEIAEEPEAEVAHTARLLAERGYTADDEWLMARYATILGEDRRHELLIFYLERLAGSGYTLEAFENNALKPQFAALGEALTARALASFTIEA